MKKLLAISVLLLTTSLGWSVTPTTTGNAFMVENTTGNTPGGTACYEFQTNPTCSANIVNLTGSSFTGLLNSSNTWTGINTYQSTSAFTGPISLGGSFGTSGQALTTNVTGAPSWSSVTSPSSTTTWTAAQTFSSVTANNINISTSVSVASIPAYLLIFSSTSYDTTGSSATTVASFIPTFTSVVVTPHRTTSRIEIFASGALSNAVQTEDGLATIMKNGSSLPGAAIGLCDSNTSAAGSARVSCAMDVIDIPNTTSPITYAVGIRTNSGGSTVTWNPAGGATSAGAITVKEWSY